MACTVPTEGVLGQCRVPKAVPLKERFMAQLDLHSSQLIRVIRAKGGATHQKIDIMDTLDQSDAIEVKRECILRSLCAYLNEDSGKLIKKYVDIDGNDCQEEMLKMVLGIFVVRHERAEPTHDPEDIGIVLEGLEVLSEVRSVPFAVAVLLGLIYIPST
ncbi:hypothetical protein NFI96_024381 [Prochilodus magdalenae]|nr:hypothetical protein NFI96_024381 [Prochilodus magdalenae]